MSRLLSALGACGERWLLPRSKPRVDVLPVGLAGPHAVIRDDLMHPLCSGNKLRKLDFIFPQLIAAGATDIVTCGGAQSAHAAAVAVVAAERGISAHLVFRGGPLPAPTGYALISNIYATTVSHVSRDVYGASVDRSAALDVGAASARAHAAKTSRAQSICVIGEGGRNAGALLGVARLVAGLAEGVDERSGTALGAQRATLVLAAGTGTTAVGLALGIALAGLPWRVVAVPVAASPAALEDAGAGLLRKLGDAAPAFALAAEAADLLPRPAALDGGVSSDRPLAALPLSWAQRTRPRHFGVVLPGDVEACAAVARSSGVLIDPVYTLAAWEVAAALRSAGGTGAGEERVILLHTGGTLGIFGLAQRYPGEFAVATSQTAGQSYK